jgi:hypothetical protein
MNSFSLKNGKNRMNNFASLDVVIFFAWFHRRQWGLGAAEPGALSASP